MRTALRATTRIWLVAVAAAGYLAGSVVGREQGEAARRGGAGQEHRGADASRRHRGP